MSVLTDLAVTALTGFGILVGVIIAVLLFLCVSSFFSDTGNPNDWDKIVGGITCLILLCLVLGYGVRL